MLCGHSSGCSIALRAAAAGLPVDGLARWEAPLAGVAADTQAWSDEVERRMDTGDVEGAHALHEGHAAGMARRREAVPAMA